MHSSSSSSPARRNRRRAERRTSRRPAILATGLAFGIAAAATLGATTPAAYAEADAERPSFTLASYTTSSISTTLASTSVSASVTQEVTTEAAEALSSAEAVVAAAGSVTSEIAASGLDIGEPEPTIDTAELQAAVAQLEAAETLPAPLVPDLTDDVTSLIASVDTRVNQLRGSLEGAKARQAEAEAAEAARLAAEAAAAAAAAEAAAAEEEEAAAAEEATAAPVTRIPSAPRPAPAAPVTGPVTGGNSPGEAQATARAMLGSYGWGDDQFSCLVSLWNKESGWNYQALNRSSGAYGIPQALPGSKMASAGADWQTNAGTQIAWGFGYISGRYGTPCGAYSHSQSVGWY